MSVYVTQHVKDNHSFIYTDQYANRIEQNDITTSKSVYEANKLTSGHFEMYINM